MAVEQYRALVGVAMAGEHQVHAPVAGLGGRQVRIARLRKGQNPGRSGTARFVVAGFEADDPLRNARIIGSPPSRRTRSSRDASSMSSMRELVLPRRCVDDEATVESSRGHVVDRPVVGERTH